MRPSFFSLIKLCQSKQGTRIVLQISIFVLKLKLPHRNRFLESTNLLSHWTLFYFILCSLALTLLCDWIYTAAVIYYITSTAWTSVAVCYVRELLKMRLENFTAARHSAKSELWNKFMHSEPWKLERLTESVSHPARFAKCHYERKANLSFWLFGNINHPLSF